MSHAIFGDGGSDVNAGSYKQTDAILPKHIDVAIKFHQTMYHSLLWFIDTGTNLE